MHLPHDGFTYHPVQACPVEQERTHVHGSVAIVGSGKACPGKDDDRPVLSGGNLNGCGQDGLAPDLGVIHVGVRYDRPLIGRLPDECGQDIHRIEPPVRVGKYAPHFHAYRPDKYPCARGPARMFVKDGGAKLFLPYITTGQFAQVLGRHPHLLRNLADGIAVQTEISLRHGHLHPVRRAE